MSATENETWTFLLRCLLYNLLNGSVGMICATAIDLNAPLMNLFNKTSVETLGIDDGGALFLSVNTWGASVTSVVALAFIVPIMDWRGRKILVVYGKFLFVFLGGLFMISSWYFQSAFLYLAGSLLGICALTIVGICDPIFMSEIAPEKHRGFLSASSITISAIGSGLLMLVLSRTDVLGSDERWGWIVVLALVFSVGMLLVGIALPEGSYREEEEDLSVFVKHHIGKMKDMLSRKSLRKMQLLLFLIQLFTYINMSALEAQFPIPLYKAEGMQVDEVLTMNLIVYICTVPTAWLGPIVIDRLSTKRLIFLLSIAFFGKTVLHIVNQQIPMVFLAYFNQVFHRLITGGGIGAICMIVAGEVLPREFVVTGGQIAMMASLLLGGMASSAAPFMFASALPVLFVVFEVLNFAMTIAILRLLASEKHEDSEKQPLLSKLY